MECTEYPQSESACLVGYSGLLGSHHCCVWSHAWGTNMECTDFSPSLLSATFHQLESCSLMKSQEEPRAFPNFQLFKNPGQSRPLENFRLISGLPFISFPSPRTGCQGRLLRGLSQLGTPSLCLPRSLQPACPLGWGLDLLPPQCASAGGNVPILAMLRGCPHSMLCLMDGGFCRTGLHG